MIVYKITNQINNKIYIGITTNTLKYRWCRHLTEGRNPKNTKHLYKAIRKYGENNFKIETIAETDNFEELGELERYYISKYNSTNPKVGYNLTYGGEKNQYDGNSQAKLKVEDIIFIREKYNECKLSQNECRMKYYPNMSRGGFAKIWLGVVWKGIMDDVYTKENKDFHRKQRACHGEKNGNAKFSDEEVLEIRKFYVTHTLKETYEKYNKGGDIQNSFRGVIDHSYSHLPIYSKIKKKWFLKGVEVNINDY